GVFRAGYPAARDRARMAGIRRGRCGGGIANLSAHAGEAERSFTDECGVLYGECVRERDTFCDIRGGGLDRSGRGMKNLLASISDELREALLAQGSRHSYDPDERIFTEGE